MTTSNARAALHEVLEAVVLIAQHMRAGRAEFMRDRASQKAVAEHLSQIARAAERLPPLIRESAAGIVWHELAEPVDEARSLDPVVMWQLLEEQIPRIRSLVEQELRSPP